MIRQSPERAASKATVTVATLAIIVAIGFFKFYASLHAHAATAVPHSDAGLQRIVDEWLAQNSFHAAVQVQELDGSGRMAQRGQATAMVTASTYKLYVAYAVLHQVEQGTLSMQAKTRTGQTVNQTLSRMIVYSDNTSAEALGALVGWQQVDSLAAAAGTQHTRINNYDRVGNPVNGSKQSTAADLGLILAKLHEGTLLNQSNTQWLLGLMKTQHYRERVPAGVPAGIAVADKPGWLGNVENDAAVVYGPKSTYVLVVMTDGSTPGPLADLSQKVYSYLEQ